MAGPFPSYSVAPTANRANRVIAIFDTSSLISLVQGRELRSMFAHASCEVVIPHHVIAELDHLTKGRYRQSDYGQHRSGPRLIAPSAAAVNGIVEDAAVATEQTVDFAKRAARELAQLVPDHFDRDDGFRVVDAALYSQAKRHAEAMQLDDTQRSFHGDNRILAFAQYIMEKAGDRARVVFVTDDNLLTVAGHFQFGRGTVFRSTAWQNALPKDGPAPAIPLSGHAPVALMPEEVPLTTGGQADVTALLSVTEDSTEGKGVSVRGTALSKPSYGAAVLAHHLHILGSVSEQDIDRQLRTFEEHSIGVTDRQFAAYYLYRLRKGERLCTWLNTRGACSHEVNTGEKCGYVHKCLYCGLEEDHGWCDYDRCGAFQKLEYEIVRARLSTDDVWKQARGLLEPTALPKMDSNNFPSLTTDDAPVAGAAPPRPPAALTAVPVDESLAAKVVKQKPATNQATSPSSTKALRVTILVKSAEPTKADVDAALKSYPVLLQHIRMLFLGQPRGSVRYIPIGDLFDISQCYVKARAAIGISNKMCFDFNGYGCDGGCGYPHICSLCVAEGHSMDKCPIVKKLQEYNTQPAYFSVGGTSMVLDAAGPYFLAAYAHNPQQAPSRHNVSEQTRRLAEKLCMFSPASIEHQASTLRASRVFVPPRATVPFIACFMDSAAKGSTVKACCYFNSTTAGCSAPNCLLRHVCMFCASSSHSLATCSQYVDALAGFAHYGVSDENMVGFAKEVWADGATR